MTRRSLSSWILGLFGTLALPGMALAATPQDYRPSFHPDELKGPPPGRANEILVLGTAHLSALPPAFRPEMVHPLLVRLAAWKPTAIATEDLSGLQCDSLRR